MKKCITRIALLLLLGILIGLTAFSFPCRFVAVYEYEGESYSSIDSIIYESTLIGAIKCTVGDTYRRYGEPMDEKRPVDPLMLPIEVMVYPNLFERISINLSLFRLMVEPDTRMATPNWDNVNYIYVRVGEKQRHATLANIYSVRDIRIAEKVKNRSPKNIVRGEGSPAAAELMMKLIYYVRPDRCEMTDRISLFNSVKKEYPDFVYEIKKLQKKHTAAPYMRQN